MTSDKVLDDFLDESSVDLDPLSRQHALELFQLGKEVMGQPEYVRQVYRNNFGRLYLLVHEKFAQGPSEDVQEFLVQTEGNPHVDREHLDRFIDSSFKALVCGYRHIFHTSNQTELTEKVIRFVGSFSLAFGDDMSQVTSAIAQITY